MAKRKFDKKSLTNFKKLILEERSSVLKDMGIQETSLQSTIKEASGDHSSYSYHMADQGSDTHDREKTFLLAARENKYLVQLDNALDRIENKTYGICMICGELIEKERLEAVLVAKYHVACKLKLEKSKNR